MSNRQKWNPEEFLKTRRITLIQVWDKKDKERL